MTQETLDKANNLERSLHFLKQELNWLDGVQEKESKVETGFDRNTFIVYRGIELSINKDKADGLASEHKQKLLSEIESIEKELAAL